MQPLRSYGRYERKEKMTWRPALRRELLKFCKTTSLRGIPRIIKADGICLKLVWAMFVACLVCGCLTNLILIVKQYLMYDVMHLPSRRYSPNASFPSFTVCNQKPLSETGKRFIQSKKWRTPKEFWKKLIHTLVQSGQKNERMNNSSEKEYQKLLQKYMMSLITPTGYWSNLPDNTDPTILGLSKDSLIQSCQVTGVNRAKDPPIYSHECGKVGNWRTINDANRLNCFMYTLNSGARSEALEIDLEIFLDHDLESSCVECMKHDTSTQMSGARVVLHELDTYPDVTKEGFNVMPGTLTEVKFQPVLWKNMEPPYGVCMEVPRKIETRNESFSYNAQTCNQLTKQRKILKNCSCEFPALPKLPLTSLGAKPPSSCFNIGNINNFNYGNLADAAKKIRCATLIVFNDDGETDRNRRFFRRQNENCPSPCEFFSYDATVTQAEWPRKDYHLQFAKQRLKPDSRGKQVEYAGLFRIYEELDDAITKVNRSDMPEEEKKEEMRDLKIKLHSLGVISRNFLTLKFTRKDYFIKEMQEKAVRTLAETMSQVGGLFSMWIGLTLIWIVELVDLFIRIVRIICGHRYPSDNDSDHNGAALRLRKEGDLDDKSEQSPIIPVVADRDKNDPSFQFSDYSQEYSRYEYPNLRSGKTRTRRNNKESDL